MSKSIEITDLSAFFFTQDICKSIDTSYISKRISSLYDPKHFFESRPQTQKVEHRVRRQRMKIIPELRGAVDILKARISSGTEIKGLSRPCTRLKIESRDIISPGKYYRPSVSTGGHEFSQSPRLSSSIQHKYESNP